MPVYFLQPVSGGPVKIGYSADVEARRAQLEAHYGQPLALLATLPGGLDEEQEIHRRFASLRFGRSEQFRPGPELMAFIGRPLLVDPNPDVVEAMDSEWDLVTVKCRRWWKGWLSRFADAKQLTMSDLINQAVIKYAEDEGFESPPKR